MNIINHETSGAIFSAAVRPIEKRQNNLSMSFRSIKNFICLSILIVPVAGILSGCATAKGPLYSELPRPVPTNDKGLVLIYSHYLPLGKNFKIYANGSLVAATMGDGKFIHFLAEPGELHISSTGNSDNRGAEDLLGPVAGGAPGVVLNEVVRAIGRKQDLLVLPIAAGETYYVDMHNGFSREKMVLVPTEEGAKKIQNCHYAHLQARTSAP